MFMNTIVRIKLEDGFMGYIGYSWTPLHALASIKYIIVGDQAHSS